MVQRESKPIKCKYCHSKNIYRFGHYKRIQRYFCNSCGRKFVNNDALPKMKTPVPIIADALNSYYGGMSLDNIVDNIAQQTGVRMTDAGIYNWIVRFTKEALNKTKDLHPIVGDKWIADECMLDIGGKKTWHWDIIDTKTRYILATHLSHTRTTQDAKRLMEKATSVADKIPKVIVTDALRAYIDGIELTFGADTLHIQSSPFAEAGLSTNMIERWHSTLKTRTNIMRGLSNLKKAKLLLDGFVFYYNYFRPHESLDNRTPAKVAKIKTLYKDWTDVLRFSVPTVEQHAEDTLMPRHYRFKMDSRNFKCRKPQAKRKRKQRKDEPTLTIYRMKRQIS
ncbi:IS6 family transposase [Chloroflexota bacterium]